MNILEDQRIAANIVTDVLLELSRLSKPDTSLDMLDNLAERMIRESGGEPYNKGYKPDWAVEPFPATICCSVNHEICHVPPRGRSLREGDIVKYDLGVRYNGGCGDAALTVAVGKIDNRKERAMYYGRNALYEAIKIVRDGIPISAIGKTIQRYVEPRGYTIIKEYAGHYIGKEMHQEPLIPHIYYKEYDDKFLREGDVICIEPMITPGNGKNAISAEDKWTAFCIDHKPVVMFEHMILVTKVGCEILTKHI